MKIVSIDIEQSNPLTGVQINQNIRRSNINFIKGNSLTEIEINQGIKFVASTINQGLRIVGIDVATDFQQIIPVIGPRLDFSKATNSQYIAIF